MIQRETLLKLLKEKGLYKKHYSPNIDKLYEIEGMIKDVKKSIKVNGFFIKTASGVKKNPASDLLAPLLREFRTICSLLKLSPKDAGVTAKPDDDGFDDL